MRLSLFVTALLCGCSSWSATDTDRTLKALSAGCKAAPAVTAMVCAGMPDGPDKERCEKAHAILSGLQVSEVCK